MRKYDRFLYGSSMIGQKESKEPGDPITYYEVVRVDGSNVEYKPIYDRMQKD